MPNLPHYLRRLARETHGVEIVEAAAVLPLMFMILLGIFWFGEAFSIYGAITRAAQEGARAGATSYCSTCASPLDATTRATNAVNSALTASNLDPSKISKPPAAGSLSVQVIQTPGTNVVSVISVSFQYPFQFGALPFTWLSKQQILLPASARVRLEDQ